MIGQQVKQPTGYTAFVPFPFPPEGLFDVSQKTLQKLAEAERLLGKLDGVSGQLPDSDFFLSMYIMKDATYSSQIEGTRATMMEAIELSAGVQESETDARDILRYIKALEYAMNRMREFPFSLRFIREIHKELMTDARASHFADPGEFRRTQNWIGGTTLENAAFVPPPVEDMNRCLDDIEAFIHNETYLPLLQVGLFHAQFETVHPFLDGNGRTGRILISLFLYARCMLEKPVLFLSSYFKKHQKVYYDRLDGYHNGKVEEWIDFFLDGIIEIAKESIEVSKQIVALHIRDMQKIQSLGKREA